MFRSISCFVVVLLKKTIPFDIKAIPIVRLRFLDVYNGILNCISVLNDGNFHIRGVIAENHSTNVKACKVLVKNFPLDNGQYCIKNPSNSAQHIFLMFDTVHLVKNIRNNLISSRIFQVPQFLFNLQDTLFNIPPGLWKSVFGIIFTEYLGCDPYGIYCKSRAAGLFPPAAGPKTDREVLKRTIYG